MLLIRSLFVFTLLFVSSAQAQSSGGGGGRFELGLASSNFGFSKASSQLNIGPTFGFTLLPWLQIGTDISYQSMSYRGGSTYNWMFLFGPIINIGPSFDSSFFVNVGLGHRTGGTDSIDATTADPDGLAFFFMVGRRFPLSGNIFFRPSFGMFSSGTTAFIIRPLAVSVSF